MNRKTGTTRRLARCETDPVSEIFWDNTIALTEIGAVASRQLVAHVVPRSVTTPDFIIQYADGVESSGANDVARAVRSRPRALAQVPRIWNRGRLFANRNAAEIGFYEMTENTSNISRREGRVWIIMKVRLVAN